MRSKQKGRKKYFISVLLVLTCLLIILAAVNHKRILHLYHGVTLFETSRLNGNFRNLDQRFPSIKVAAGDDLFLFEENMRDLPDTYNYFGENRSINDFIERTDTTGLLVAQKNQILYEAYFNGYSASDRMITWSLSKPIISALIGIAIEDGSISSVNDLVTDYVPSLSDSGYREVSIKDALQMSSGIQFNEDYGDRKSDVNQMGARSVGIGGSLENYLISLEREKAPGTYHKYHSSDTQVLGLVLRAATNMSIADYMHEKLWEPAGMAYDAHWLIDSAGVESAFGGLNVNVRDLARFATIYLNNGYLMDQQIIPQQWVIDSIKTDEPHLIPGNNPYSEHILGYGYQWWIPDGIEDDFLAMGIYGQAIYINKAHNIVIIKTSAYKNYTIDGEQMELESIEFYRQLARDMSK